MNRRAGNIGFSLRVGSGWEEFGPEYPNYITKSESGSQSAEALIYWTGWTGYPGGALPAAEPCHYLRSQDVRPTPASLATFVAAAPGTDLISGPSETTLGGHPVRPGYSAEYVVLTVREDVGCDPGFFFTYPNVFGGAFWPETVPGDRIRVWIVDVEGDLLFIAAETHSQASAGLEMDMADIVQSIRFD